MCAGMGVCHAGLCSRLQPGLVGQQLRTPSNSAWRLTTCLLCVVLSAAYKRVPASQHLSDAELLDQLFKTGSKGGKAQAEK